jgi:hypothetical protein
MLAMRRSKGRRRSSPHRSLSIPNKAAPKGEALREAAPVPSFDGRRFRPTRASPFSRKRVAAAVSVARPTTLRARRTKGRIVRAATERQTGRPRVARREDNARAHAREAHARRSEPPIVPIQKRMGRREARHSSARGFRATRFDVRRHAEREVETSQDALSPADRNSFEIVHASGSIGCPFRRYRWQTPIARTSGRVARIAKAVRAALG